VSRDFFAPSAEPTTEYTIMISRGGDVVLRLVNDYPTRGAARAVAGTLTRALNAATADPGFTSSVVAEMAEEES
jgi:hypothetical protein